MRPELEAFGLARRRAYHAGDYLLAISACITHPLVLFSIPTLVRACIESCARAAFLLEPDVDSRELLRRWLNERLDSLLEEVRLAEGVGSPGAQAAAAVRLDHVRDLVEAAESRGFYVRSGGLIRGNNGWIATPQLYPPRPKSMPAIERMVDQGAAGPTMYRWTSAVIHATDHGLLSYIVRDQARDSGTPGVSFVPVGVSSLKLAVLLAPALTTAETVAQGLNLAAGLDRSDWDARAQPILRQWRAWLHDKDALAAEFGSGSAPELDEEVAVSVEEADGAVLGPAHL